MIAINASLAQVPVELSVGPNQRDIVSYEVLRRLCRCTDKTMRTIVQEGVDREDIIKVRIGRETFITATSKLLKTFKYYPSLNSQLFPCIDLLLVLREVM